MFVNTTCIYSSFGDFSFSRVLIMDLTSLPAGHRDNLCSVVGQMETNLTVTNTVTTDFIDDGKEEMKSFSSVKHLDGYNKGGATIADFLAKPYLVTTITLAANTVPSNVIVWHSTVSSMITANAYYADKLEGFQLYRGTACVKIVINATPFHQGRYLLHFLPNESIHPGTYNTMRNLTIMQKTQQPNIEMDVKEGSMVLKMPYIAATDYFDHSLPIDWGTFYLTTLSPLGNSGTNGGISADLSVYFWIEDLELAAPIVPQMNRYFSKKGIQDSEKLPAGSISNGLSLVSKAAGTLSAIPTLSAYMGPVSWAADIAARTARSLGFSKPVDENVPMVVATQQERYAACSDGPTYVYPLSLRNDNKLRVIDSVAPVHADEMSWEYLRSREVYLTSFNWPTSGTGSSIGYNLYTFLASPSNLGTTGSTTVGTHTANWTAYTPIGYLAQGFTYWRGSFEITLKFVKTQFHTGRVCVTFSPLNATIGNAITLANSVLSLREIVDLKTTDEITLTLPYLSASPYLLYGSLSGTLNVLILNELRAPETCAQSINVLVYVKGGDDLELACPYGNGFGTPVPFYGQMDVTLDKVVADQSKKSLTESYAELCQGEQFTSVKQLISRFDQWHYQTQITNAAVAFNPWATTIPYMTSSGVSAPNTGGDVYNYISPMYAFYRGGMRLGIDINSTGSTDISVQAGLYQGAAFSSVIYNMGIGIVETNPITWFNQGHGNGFPGYCQTDSSSSSSYYNIPYHNATRASTNFLDYTGAVYANKNDQPSTRLNCYAATNYFSNANIYRSVRDDFQFSYFVGCPPVLGTYT